MLEFELPPLRLITVLILVIWKCEKEKIRMKRTGMEGGLLQRLLSKGSGIMACVEGGAEAIDQTLLVLIQAQLHSRELEIRPLVISISLRNRISGYTEKGVDDGDGDGDGWSGFTFSRELSVGLEGEARVFRVFMCLDSLSIFTWYHSCGKLLIRLVWG